MPITATRIRCTCCRTWDTSYSAPDDHGYYHCPTCKGPNALKLTPAQAESERR